MVADRRRVSGARRAYRLWVIPVLGRGGPRWSEALDESELARSHQVLAFTCHPYLAAMFEEEGARLTELPASPRARARAKTA